MEIIRSNDGSQKYIFDDINSNSKYEAIFFVNDNSNSNCLCISTQIGCSVGCVFCVTGTLGLNRNLTSDELFNMVQFIKNDLQKDKKNFEEIALMGMGEPLLNYDNIVGFYKKIKQIYPEMKLFLSTSGVPGRIKKLADSDTDFGLFVSLHSPYDEERSMLIPTNKKYGINSLLEECIYYSEKKDIKINMNYLLIDGINNDEQHIESLIKLLKNYKNSFRVKLLLYNENDTLNYKRPSLQNAENIKKKIENSGLEVNISISKGQDIAGACGQMKGGKQ